MDVTSGNNSDSEVEFSCRSLELTQWYPLCERNPPRVVELIIHRRLVLLLVVSDGLDLFGVGDERAVAATVIELKFGLNCYRLLQRFRICETSKTDLIINLVLLLN